MMRGTTPLFIYLFIVATITPLFFRGSTYTYNRLLTYHPKRSQIDEDNTQYETMTHAVLRVATLNFIIAFMVLNLILLVSAYYPFPRVKFGLFITSVAVLLNMSIRVSATSSSAFLAYDNINTGWQLIESGRMLGIVFINIIYFSIVILTGFQIISGAEINVVISFSQLIYLSVGVGFISFIGAIMSELTLLAVGVPESILEYE